MEQEIQGGYYPEPTISPEEHAKRYEHILTESMSLLVEDAKELLAYEGDKLLQDALQRHIATLELAQVHLQEYGLRIVSMVIQGEADSIGEFATDSSLDKEVELVPFPEVESFKQDQATWVNPQYMASKSRTHDCKARKFARYRTLCPSNDDLDRCIRLWIELNI
jgi:hypothetical protein